MNTDIYFDKNKKIILYIDIGYSVTLNDRFYYVLPYTKAAQRQYNDTVTVNKNYKIGVVGYLCRHISRTSKLSNYRAD